MMRFYPSRFALLLASLGFLIPVAARAAGGTEIPVEEPTEIELQDMLTDMMDGASPEMDAGMGGGGGYMPYPPMGSMVTVDVSYVQEIVPDSLNISAYCSLFSPVSSQEQARTQLNALYKQIKDDVGTDGRVRKSGGISFYPYYDASGMQKPDTYTGNLNLTVRVLKTTAVERITELLEGKNCTSSYDARLLNTQDIEMKILDKLADRLEKRKKVFEKLLGRKLTHVTSVYLNTWADGYGTYDPETGTVEATTTLSVGYELGRGSSVSPRG